MAAPIAAYGFSPGTGSTVPDESGNGHTLTVGSGSYTASGHTGPGFQNIGGGNTTGASGTVGAVTGTACTVMAWVKPNTLAAGGVHLICGAMQAGGSTDFALWTQRGDFGSPNVLQGDARLGGGPVAVNGSALTVGTWAHVALTYDGATLKLWLNGTMVASVANTNTINNSPTFFVAGMNGAGTAAVTVDDARYFATDESANIGTWMATPVTSASSVTGTASAAFAGLTGAANGTRATAGTGSLAAGALTGAGTGVVDDSGVGTAAFGALGGAAAGVRATAGAAAAGFGGLTGAATAGADVSGTALGMLGSLSGAAVALRSVVGAGSLAGGALAGSATDQSPTELHHPSSDVVMVAWLQQYADLAQSATTLPAPKTWLDTGFVTVTAVGGNPNPYIPERAPVFQVDCWAANAAAAGAKSVSRKIPRGKANELADLVVYATYGWEPREVELPLQYLPVWIESVTPVSEVREIPDPVYARWSVDVQIKWIEQVAASYAL